MLERLKDIIPEVVDEVLRGGRQGSAEIANLLFNGNSFVPYGPGQNPVTPEKEQGHHHGHEAAEHEVGGEGVEI
jgi:hypothetical protein